MKYQPTTIDQHERDEEMQWAEIIASGNAACGMAVIFLQKLCATVHEFAPAADIDALKEEHIVFLRKRIAARIRKVQQVMEANGLGNIEGVAELNTLLEHTRRAEIIDDLIDLAEPAHKISHTIIDALQKRAG